jgi:transposase InsO family protein
MAGWLYLAVILDLYSRAVVGWAMSRSLDCRLAMDALNMAVDLRGTGPEVLHSDQESTYEAADYRALLGRYGIRQSMSRKGNCWVGLSIGYALTARAIGSERNSVKHQVFVAVVVATSQM